MAAASGIVRVGTTLFVVADDEHDLTAIDADGSARRFPFATGRPPDEQAARKRAKRDVEALALAGETLIGLGSGSTPRRRWGFAWRIDASGGPVGAPEPLDLGPLYDELARSIPDLNVEGATFTGERLLLVQRGNGPGGVNAVATLRWAGDARATLAPGAIERIERYELGTGAGVRLCFTDAACAGPQVIFTAVAEAGDSTYHDGVCVGAAVGILDGPTFELDPPLKVEGVEVGRIAPDALELLLVVDDDRPESAAQLLRARLPTG